MDIAKNLRRYIQAFPSSIRDIFEHFDFDYQIDRPSRAKKVTDPEITKNFDFDIFEEEGRVFRYLNGGGNTMRFS